MVCEHRCRKSEEAYIELLQNKLFGIKIALVMENEKKESTQDDNHD